MAIKIGIVGLPNVGKSTFFNAITNSKIEASNYPFATIEPNISVINVEDERAFKLQKIYDSEKIVFSQLIFYDIAGLVKGASKGEGLGNKFLSNIKEVDVILHLVRLFDDKDIVHVNNKFDPIDDLNTINLELIISDLELIQKWISKSEKKIITLNNPKELNNLKLFKKIKSHLENEKMLNDLTFNSEESTFLKQFNFLTLKPMLYVGNVDEDFFVNNQKNNQYKNFSKFMKNNNNFFTIISAKIEDEISKLDSFEEKNQLLQEYNLKENGISTIAKEIFNILDLKTFFTCGKSEIHLWKFQNGIKAPRGAGIIHSDFEKGFIKAEIFKYDDILKYKKEEILKQKGLIKLEGKDYFLKDGDICHFRFNL